MSQCMRDPAVDGLLHGQRLVLLCHDTIRSQVVTMGLHQSGEGHDSMVKETRIFACIDDFCLVVVMLEELVFICDQIIMPTVAWVGARADQGPVGAIPSGGGAQPHPRPEVWHHAHPGAQDPVSHQGVPSSHGSAAHMV